MRRRVADPFAGHDQPMDPEVPMVELLETSERLACLGSWVMDLPSLDARWSDGLYRILGMRPGQEPATLEVLDAVTHPDDRERLALRLRQVITDPASIGAESAITTR